MSHPRITIIGAGNMGASLLGGLIQNGFSADQLAITDTDQHKLLELQQRYHVHTNTDNNTAIKNAACVILAIKPQVLASVLHPLASQITTAKPLLISIAAGITIATIEHCLNNKAAIVRAMPNTPALIGMGASALCANAMITHSQKELATKIFQAVGKVVWLDEERKLDIVTALSGSGPAYFFLIMEIMEKTAVDLGLDAETAHELTIQTALGAAKMAEQSHKDLATLGKNVTSPGGTTERALCVLEAKEIRAIFTEALTAAAERSKELAQQFAKDI